MEQRRTSATKHAEKDQGTTAVRSGIYYVVHLVLGIVLISAGVLKLLQLAFEIQDESIWTLLQMVLAEAEFLGGIWMVGGFDPERAHPWIVATFAGLAAASLFRGLAGKCSCGCFGAFDVNPWGALVLDLAAFSALLAWRPPSDPEVTQADHPASIAGWVLLATGISIMGWRYADSITLAGTAMRDGRPLAEAMLTFTGESGIAAVRTDLDGRFRLPLVGKGRYSVAHSATSEVPAPTSGSAVGRAEKKAAGRFKHRSSMTIAAPGGTLSWVDISRCAEQNKVVEFK